MIRAMVIMILAGLAFLQNYLPDGMAYNPQQCEYCPTPTAERQHRKVTSEPTVEATPKPTPTEESWTCPAIEELTKKEYKDLCMESCKSARLNGCGRVCGDCWESE